MNVEVKITRQFEKNAKSLIKKYQSLKEELRELQSSLLINPRIGVQIKENIYKIRISVKSKGKGKSGGLRIVTYIEAESLGDEESKIIYVYLLSIYDKSNTENISDSEISKIISTIDYEEQ